MFSSNVVALFEALLADYQIPSSHQDVVGMAQIVKQAREELVRYHQFQSVSQPPVSPSEDQAEGIKEPELDEADRKKEASEEK